MRIKEATTIHTSLKFFLLWLCFSFFFFFLWPILFILSLPSKEGSRAIPHVLILTFIRTHGMPPLITETVHSLSATKRQTRWSLLGALLYSAWWQEFVPMLSNPTVDHKNTKIKTLKINEEVHQFDDFLLCWNYNHFHHVGKIKCMQYFWIH